MASKKAWRHSNAKSDFSFSDSAAGSALTMLVCQSRQVPMKSKNTALIPNSPLSEFAIMMRRQRFSPVYRPTIFVPKCRVIQERFQICKKCTTAEVMPEICLDGLYVCVVHGPDSVGEVKLFGNNSVRWRREIGGCVELHRRKRLRRMCDLPWIRSLPKLYMSCRQPNGIFPPYFIHGIL